MVENFAEITKNGLVAYVDVGGVSFYREDQPDDIVMKVINTYNRGIQWVNNGHLITKFCTGDGHLRGCPSLDLNYVVAVFSNSVEYPAPNNAVIFNADGSLHKHLQMPKLISEKGEKFGYGDFFEYPRWKKNKAGELLTTIGLSFDRYAFEVRVLNPQEGTFGECLSSAIH